jgi:hypothetical protein
VCSEWGQKWLALVIEAATDATVVKDEEGAVLPKTVSPEDFKAKLTLLREEQAAAVNAASPQ